MRENRMNNPEQAVISVESYAGSSLSESSLVTHRSYHELADRPVVEGDVLAQLHTNLETLRDLQGRMSFLMREVGYLLKA